MRLLLLVPKTEPAPASIVPAFVPSPLTVTFPPPVARSVPLLFSVVADTVSPCPGAVAWIVVALFSVVRLMLPLPAPPTVSPAGSVSVDAKIRLFTPEPSNRIEPGPLIV